MTRAASPDGDTTSIRRRRLIAGAATLATALLARQPASVGATSGTGTDGNLVLGSQGGGANTATKRTELVPVDSTFTDDALFSLNAQTSPATASAVIGLVSTGGNGGDGIHGIADGNGIGVVGHAVTDAGTGVTGYTDTSMGTGVAGYSDAGYALFGNTNSGYGLSANSGSGIGMNGFSVSGTGVASSSTDGTGTYAQSTNGVAVLAKSTNGYGVQAESQANIAIYGKSATSIGVYGVADGGSGSAAPYGVVGANGAGQGFGIYGVTTVAGSAAFAGGTNNASAYAALFTGTVIVNGKQIVGGTKSAAVPHPDGSLRLLYCVESPESWFEDFGVGTLAAGKADVKFDPDFLAVVDTSAMHVFVTAYGNYQVHVAARSATGFTAQVTAGAGDAARGQATVSGTFSYRVVAKRKDVQAERLAKFTMPQVKIAVPPQPKSAAPLPKPPPAPKRPRRT